MEGDAKISDAIVALYNRYNLETKNVILVTRYFGSLSIFHRGPLIEFYLRFLAICKMLGRLYAEYIVNPTHLDSFQLTQQRFHDAYSHKTVLKQLLERLYITHTINIDPFPHSVGGLFEF